MKTPFKSNREILFLTHTTPPQKEGIFDVILSPEFYWVKKVSLPVKKISDAKKLAESVYEGSLPPGNFSYEVSKEGEEFVLIAYDKEEITKKLAHYFIDNAKVHAIYFAQYEFKDLDSCCTIDNKSSLVNLDGVLVQVPRNCAIPKLYLSDLLAQKELSNHKVKLGSLEEEAIDRGSFFLLVAVVGMFLGAFVLDYIDYKMSVQKIEERKAKIIQRYNLPPTSFQLKSIKASLEKLFKEQKRMRDALYAFSKLPLSKGEYIEMIDLDKKSATLKVHVTSNQRESFLKRMLAKEFKIQESDFKNNIVSIKIAL